jgi:hypothetical protein
MPPSQYSLPRLSSRVRGRLPAPPLAQKFRGCWGSGGLFLFPPQPIKVKPHVFWSVFHVKKENNRWPSKALVKVTHRPALICWPPLNNSRRRDIVDTKKDFHLRRFDVEESCSRFGGSCWWLVSNKRCDHQASTFGAGDPPRYIVFYLGFSPFFYLEILKQIKEREKTSAFFLPRFNYKMLGNVWRG